MSFRMLVTYLVTISVTAGLLALGCGGDSSPTKPVDPPTPTPPPAPTVSTIEVAPTSASLEVGKTQRFSATAKASDGSTIGGVTITWSSSNTSVVTINNTGVATAVAAGTATIRAAGNGKSSSPVSITVTLPPVASVTVSPSSAQLLIVGDMRTFTATAQADGGIARDDVTITWSSSDTGVVSITPAGVAAAVAAGTASIRASAEGVNSAPVMITVSEPPPEPLVIATIVVSPDMASITEGQTGQFEAVAMTDDGMPVPGVEFTWASSDEMVATVDMIGVATGVGVGETMITATADSISGSATLTVTKPEVAIVTVSPPTASIEVGAMQQFEAMATTSDGMEISDVEFAWTSSDEMVATVDSNGLATGVGAGEVTITATVDEISDDAMMTVTAPLPSRSGTIMEVTAGYDMRGTVYLEHDSTGELVLRLGSDFNVLRAARIYIILSTTNRVTGNFLELVELTKFSGEQVHSLPEEVELDTYDYVIIYCKPFRLIFGAAKLE